KPIRVLFDVHSGVVWASTNLVGVDSESWTLLLGVVVLTAQGLMPSHVRQGELEALVALLDELSQVAPGAMQHELVRLLGWAGPRRVILGPSSKALLEAVSAEWHLVA